MNFNSQSVLLNKGRAVNSRYPIQSPAVFAHYKFHPGVLREAVEEFNQKLDNRPHITMHIDADVKADVLRVVTTTNEALAIWLVVKEKDVDIVHKKCFTIKGDVYFAGKSDVDVDKMIIHDILIDDKCGIFTK
jgi:hypothetical protein